MHMCVPAHTHTPNTMMATLSSITIFHRIKLNYDHHNEIFKIFICNVNYQIE